MAAIGEDEWCAIGNELTKQATKLLCATFGQPTGENLGAQDDKVRVSLLIEKSVAHADPTRWSHLVCSGIRAMISDLEDHLYLHLQRRPVLCELLRICQIEVRRVNPRDAFQLTVCFRPSPCVFGRAPAVRQAHPE